MAASILLKGCRRCLASRLTTDFLRVVLVKEQKCGYQVKTAKKKARGAQIDPLDDRSRNTDWLANKPFDRIYLSKDFAPPKYTFDDALQMHKDLADPTMMNTIESLVYANMDLNMTTKKKTKFMKEFSGLVAVPHPFDDKVRRNIAVFCKEEEEVKQAFDAGAEFVGDSDLISKILAREVPREDVDFLLCTPDMLASMSGLRLEFKDRLPTRKQGTITDIQESVKFHRTALSYKSRKISDAEGRIQVPLGPMTFTNEQLKENFTTLIKHLLDKRSVALGAFITRIELIAPPSHERHLVMASRYVAGLEEEEELVADEEEEEEVKPKAEDSDSDDEEASTKKKK